MARQAPYFSEEGPACGLASERLPAVHQELQTANRCMHELTETIAMLAERLRPVMQSHEQDADSIRKMSSECQSMPTLISQRVTSLRMDLEQLNARVRVMIESLEV